MKKRFNSHKAAFLIKLLSRYIYCLQAYIDLIVDRDFFLKANKIRLEAKRKYKIKLKNKNESSTSINLFLY